MYYNSGQVHVHPLFYPLLLPLFHLRVSLMTEQLLGGCNVKVEDFSSKMRDGEKEIERRVLFLGEPVFLSRC